MLEKQAKAKELRALLESIYNKFGDKKENLAELDDQEILQLAHNLKIGVPIATPVFDGAKESDIKALLDFC